jgi:hypothetical protein
MQHYIDKLLPYEKQSDGVWKNIAVSEAMWKRNAEKYLLPIWEGDSIYVDYLLPASNLANWLRVTKARRQDLTDLFYYAMISYSVMRKLEYSNILFVPGLGVPTSNKSLSFSTVGDRSHKYLLPTYSSMFYPLVHKLLRLPEETAPKVTVALPWFLSKDFHTDNDVKVARAFWHDFYKSVGCNTISMKSYYALGDDVNIISGGGEENFDAVMLGNVYQNGNWDQETESKSKETFAIADIKADFAPHCTDDFELIDYTEDQNLNWTNPINIRQSQNYQQGTWSPHFRIRGETRDMTEFSTMVAQLLAPQVNQPFQWHNRNSGDEEDHCIQMQYNHARYAVDNVDILLQSIFRVYE